MQLHLTEDMFKPFTQDIYKAFTNYKNSLPDKEKQLSQVNISVSLARIWTYVEPLFSKILIQVDLPNQRNIYLRISESDLQLLLLNQLFLIHENILMDHVLQIEIKENKDNIHLIFTSQGRHVSYDLTLKGSLRKMLALYQNFRIVDSYRGQISFTGLAKQKQCQFSIVFPK